MSKGRPGAQQASSDPDMAVAVADRPRKKLSFREPEILGYYNQVKQGVASRFSRKGKAKLAEVLPEAFDEDELEVSAECLDVLFLKF